MDQVVPCKGLIALIEPYYPKGEGDRPAYQLMAMLRVHLMQNGFGYSDPTMEEALYETTILRQFSSLHLDRIPDAGYTGVDKRPEHQARKMIWSIADRPSSYKKHAMKSLIGRLWRKIEYAKAQIRAKVEHPLRVIKRQFGYVA